MLDNDDFLARFLVVLCAIACMLVLVWTVEPAVNTSECRTPKDCVVSTVGGDCQ